MLAYWSVKIILKDVQLFLPKSEYNIFSGKEDICAIDTFFSVEFGE